MLRIKQHLYDEIVAHALETPDIEVCGLVGSTGDEAESVYRCLNSHAKGFWGGGASFELDPMQQFLLLETIERDGQELGAIYHSHPQISPVPSGTDRRYAEGFPGVLWIIVGVPWSPRIDLGLSQRSRKRKRKQYTWQWESREPDVWTWRMDNDRVTTAELKVY
jgi:proteasome lid subunit RPN8/RPN11